MLLLCGGEQPLLPKPALFTGTRSLLTNIALEDVISYAPKAADWVSSNACLLPFLCHAAELSFMILQAFFWREQLSDSILCLRT